MIQAVPWVREDLGKCSYGEQSPWFSWSANESLALTAVSSKEVRSWRVSWSSSFANQKTKYSQEAVALAGNVARQQVDPECGHHDHGGRWQDVGA